MLIQISCLNICARLQSHIGASIRKICEFIDGRSAAEDHIIIFCGSIFATRTYLTADDLNFFALILKSLKKYKVIFAMSHEDYYNDGKLGKIAYKSYLQSAGIPFICTQGVHEIYGIKWSFVIDDTSIIVPDSYVIAYQGILEPSNRFIGAMCNTRTMTINGNVASSGLLVQVNPEDGYRFGFIFWRDRVHPEFLQLNLPLPQLNLSFEDNTAVDFPDVKAQKVLAKFAKCSEHFVLTMRDALQRKYQCPIEVAEERYGQTMKLENPHDMNLHVTFLSRLYGDNQRLFNDYRELVQIDTYRVPAWQIEYLVWDNLFSYHAGNYIDFRQIRGATFISGRNKSGKSSIIDIIMLILFDHPVRASKIQDVINKNADGRAYVKCGLHIGEARYTIERFFENREKNKKQYTLQKFKLTKNGEDISEKTLKDTYAALHKLLPITYDKFKLNIAIQEGGSLITMPPRAKWNLAAFLLGMDYMISAQDSAKARKKHLTDQLNAIKNLTSKDSPDKQMVEVETEIAQLERKSRDDADLFATFPNNLHHKIVFLATHDAYINAVKKRQQLLLQGIKPFGGVGDTSTLKDDLHRSKVLVDAINRILEEFFRPFLRDIEQVINKILAKISDFSIEIDVLKTGFEIYVSHNMRKIPARASSGYQKFLIDLVARLVLVNRSNITNYRLVIIDEGFGCLDEANFTKVAKAVNILKRYISIVIITHLDELQSYGDQFIHVDKNAVRFGELSQAELSQSSTLHEQKPPRGAS